MVKQQENRSGIYLLPNLLTTAGLFAAFYSIVASFKGLYETAVIAIFVGMLMDGLDGRMARLTNTQTAFGAEYDSLSDMVAFGVAPALLLYTWNLHTLGKFGWLIAFIYTAAVALRLARFNTQVETADKNYFQGLACPSAAAGLASFVWLCNQHQWENALVLFVSALLVLTTATLMVSNVRFYSFKEFGLKEKISFLHVLLIVIIFVAIASNPSLMLFIGFVIYALSGPVQTLIALHGVRKKRRNVAENRRKQSKKNKN